MASKLYPENVLAVECPQCGAPAGSKCVVPPIIEGGKATTATRPHSKRKAAASAPVEEPQEITEEKLEKIKERITKLLRQAEGTDNLEEAETFMQAAQELMTRYSVQVSTEEKKREVVRRVIEYRGKGRPAHFWKAMGRDGGCLVVHGTGLALPAFNENAMMISIFGFEADCDYVEAVLQSVWNQAYAAFRIWKKQNQAYRLMREVGDKRGFYEMEQSYLYGFCAGVSTKLGDARRSAAGTSGELVLQRNLEEIKDVYDSSTRTVNVKGTRPGAGFADGYTDGQNASLGQEIGK